MATTGEKLEKAPRTLEDRISSVFRSETTNGANAAALMFDIVEDLARTRNSDPLRRFLFKADNHTHTNFKSVMGLFVNAYFGKKMVTAKADAKHPTGYSVTLKFSGNPGPSNHWGLVREHVENKGHYLDREFIKTLKAQMNPEDDKSLNLSEQEVAAMKRAKNLVKWMMEEGKDLHPSKVMTFFEQAWKDEHPASTAPVNVTGEVKDNVTSIDDLIEQKEAAA
jgi:hypothetical protein